MKKNYLYLIPYLLIFSLAQGQNLTHTYPPSATVKFPVKILCSNSKGVKVYNGGFGSALASVPGEIDMFYMLTDRGPNVEGGGDIKVFPKPNYAPMIGKFKLVGDSLKIVSTIILKKADGSPLAGLPNPVGFGATGEVAKDLSGKTLAPQAEGIDPEGLSFMKDGTFWVSDEYGPHLIHFDSGGKTIERINPFGTGKGGKKIPWVFASRRPNKGMEGLTSTPDGKYLVGIMESTFNNPKESGLNNRLTRILFYEVATGKTKQYLYIQEQEGLSNSEIAAIDNKTFLVLERDAAFPGEKEGPAFKKIFKIDITGATDVSDSMDGKKGKLFMKGSKTLEQLSMEELKAEGIVPVSKELLVDILAEIPGYPHNKPEGLAIINDTLIAISNDDDFGIVDDGKGGYVGKVLPKTSEIDRNTIYFIGLSI